MTYFKRALAGLMALAISAMPMAGYTYADETEDTKVYDAEINVTKVSSLTEDFMMGMDISSIMSEFASGVTYQDFDGNVLDNITDFCAFLAEDVGITHIRIRIWNDPYDEEGNGYGGGNCDVDMAVTGAEACAAAGLGMMLDFHYSDFWADPSKQYAPKAWADMSLDEKAVAMQEFTTDSLTKIAATGAEISLVQVGNETTAGIAGETGDENMCTLFNAASAAIRAFDENIKVVIHITNPEAGNMTEWAEILDNYSVDYDVLATSYYPYWHGTLQNLSNEMKAVKETYGKDVMVAETSFAYTLNDTDGSDNTVHEGYNDTGVNYTFNAQGQANSIRDIIATVSIAGGLGVFYWEPAWITVGDTTGLEGSEYDARVAANQELWESYGSGWASSYAADYDPDDAGLYYGGTAVDNEAMFYPDGSPVESLHVWKYVWTGAVSNAVSVDDIAEAEDTINLGSDYTLPSTVEVTYNNGTKYDPVEWDADDVAAIDVNTAGTYTVKGTITLSQEVTTGDYKDLTTAETTYTLTVKIANLIDETDAGFESGDNFTLSGSCIKDIPSTEDVLYGEGTLHWYSVTAETGIVSYNIPLTLPSGGYTFTATAMGYAGDTVTLQVLDADGNVLFESDAVTLTGWTSNESEWFTPSVEFDLTEETTIYLQLSIGISAGGWGSADALYLYSNDGSVTEVGVGDATVSEDADTDEDTDSDADVEEDEISESETEADTTAEENVTDLEEEPQVQNDGINGLTVALIVIVVVIIILLVVIVSKRHSSEG